MVLSVHLSLSLGESRTSKETAVELGQAGTACDIEHC